MNSALIFGVNGMDGSYLSDLLITKGYEVHGIVRRSSVFTTQRIEHLRGHKQFHLHYGDLSDSSNIHHLLSSIKPNELYNLGAESHVAVSFDVPEYCADVNGIGTLRLLDAIRTVSPDTRFYQASTSEMFGGYKENAPQSEATPFHPRSPYGTAKLYAYWTLINYREAYNLHASNGILFNHEAPRRGETFVTKKVTKGVNAIKNGVIDFIALGNLDAVRDWGYAPEYVEAMWLMLQQDQPSDYVIATGEVHTVREWVSWAFEFVNMPIYWEGEGLNEVARSLKKDNIVVKIDPQYFRRTEVEYLQGNATKARKSLLWAPNTNAQHICEIMVGYDSKYSNYGGKE